MEKRFSSYSERENPKGSARQIPMMQGIGACKNAVLKGRCV
jgi:hypothetical protein